MNRELARSPGVSQPTVSRIIKKLESKGIIKECTMLPDFQKLGYTLMAFTFVALRGGLKPEEIEDARRIASEDMKYCPTEIVLFERGLGHGFTGILVSFHKDYLSYLTLRQKIREYSFLEQSETDGFLISLDDEIHYRPLTFATLAQHVLAMKGDLQPEK